VVEQSLDRVALWLVTTNRCDRDGERFGSTEDESSEVAMALRGAIAWFRVAEFASHSVWTAVVMDINEIEADDPGRGRIIVACWIRRSLTRVSSSAGGTVCS